MRENRRLELKERVSNTFLKTVSAYANYGYGEILFGVADDGREVGLDDPVGDALRIENAINDGLAPRPEFEIEGNPRSRVVTLRVWEGDDKPYLYRSKAYRRSDTATVEVDSLEMRRLVLEGSNRTYDELRAQSQDLSFAALEEALRREVGVSSFDDDVMRTLGLLSQKGELNNAAALLADTNAFPGVDLARFGNETDSILDRETHAGLSVLTLLDASLAMFDRYYVYERVEGFRRVSHERVPREAFREAVANALAHRSWDVGAHVRIAMFEDRVEVTSPGGPPKGMVERDYPAGNLSVLRNPILGYVLFRLKIIEQFGTGVRRIRRSYEGSETKPRFSVIEGSVTVSLPVLGVVSELDVDERSVYALFAPGRVLSSSQVSAASGFGRDKSLRLLGQLVEKGLVRVQGAGRATRYVMS